jgi:superfamily I DNA and/or RNA helicase
MLDESITRDWASQQGIRIEELQESLFETLVRHAKSERPEAVRSLATQQRMHPAIGQLISEVFYDGALTHGVAAAQRHHELDWIPTPVLWLSTSGIAGRYEQQRGRSYENPLEISLVLQLLTRIERSSRETDSSRKEVGVISGYAAQIRELEARIDPRDSSRWSYLGIEVATVDAFQGRDRDIVVYSCARSSQVGGLGFMRDPRRLNVALSRARRLLVIVGDADMLERVSQDFDRNPFYRVIQYIKAHPQECYLVDARELLGASNVR